MITVCGEALIDVLVDGRGEVASAVGGAAVNTARTIGRLGQPVTFLGGIGVDAFGQRIARSLVADGVRLGLPSSRRATALAIAEVDASGAASYRFLVADTAAAMVTPEVVVDAAPAHARALHVGGLGLVLEPLAAASLAVVAAAADEQIVLVDPNCRPSLLAGSPGRTQSFARSFEAVACRADVIKLSVEDLAHLAPDADAAGAAGDLRRRTGAVVVLTDGPNPVRVLGRSGEATVSVPTVRVTDTVGAGDALSGALLAWWARTGTGRADLADLEAVVGAVRFGVQVAAWTCQQVGASPPISQEMEWE